MASELTPYDDRKCPIYDKVIDGELTELTKEEIWYIKKYGIVSCRTAYYKKPYKVIWGMDY